MTISIRRFTFSLVFLSLFVSLVEARQAGSLQVDVLDPSGARVTGATVLIRTPSGEQRTLETDEAGRVHLGELEAAPVELEVSAQGFRTYQDDAIPIRAGEVSFLEVRLEILPVSQEITVRSTLLPLVGPSATAIRILDREAIDELPRPSGGLQALIRILAPRSATRRGAEVTVNGFSDGGLPTRDTIREIRIDQNPYSAEHGEPGMTRVEIYTDPGSQAWHGEVYSLFNDESLDARNHFLSNRPAYQSRLYGGNISGPILPGRAAFYADYGRTEDDNNAFVNATVVDGSFQATSFTDAVPAPVRGDGFSGRVDVGLREADTLVVRYAYDRMDSTGDGVGAFALPSVAALGRSREHLIQATSISHFGTRLSNELRAEHSRQDTFRLPETLGPAIDVPEAFVGGGAESGVNETGLNRWEVTDHLGWMRGAHGIQMGGELRRLVLAEHSEYNFNGTFYFEGRLAPPLDENDDPFPGNSGPDPAWITNLESYRRTLVFMDRGMSPDAIRQLGGGASQLFLSTGEPEARSRQYEGAVFVTDDWSIRPGLTVSGGVRAQTQTNLDSGVDLAPRASVAWAPGQDPDQTLVVVRGGVGVFYGQVPIALSLAASRFASSGLERYYVTDADVLDLFPDVPTPDALEQFAIPSSQVVLAGSLRAPRTVEASVGIETALPLNFFFDLTATFVRSSHLLRSRDINAPFVSGPGEIPERPDPLSGEIFQYESTGRGRQRQVAMNLVQYVSDRFTHYTTYVWSRRESDTAGPDTFPANSWDLDSEFGRSTNDARHTLYWGGWFRLPGQIDVTPILTARSGLPFNITTGRDSNGDGLFTERPAFVAAGTEGSVATPYGTFELEPAFGEQIIQRNYAEGPTFFTVHVEAGRTFSLGEARRLHVSVQVQNLFNTLNLGPPAGNLSSPSFGVSRGLAGHYGTANGDQGNRRIELQATWIF